MNYDVVIIGGGLAGLSLAEQLLQEMPKLSVCIIHEGRFPNEEAAFKVGEATIETGAHYLREIFGSEYMDNECFIKIGMRFFYTQGEKYNEMGPSCFPANNSYQFERGKLENHAFDLLNGRADILQNTRFLDVDDDGELKKIHIIELGKDKKTLEARWLIDASGMKSVLSKKYNLSVKKKSLPNSSVWFRVDGAVMVDDIYIADEENPFLNMEGERNYSSVHIDGKGYWVWIIRISETKTSVGIAFSENIHDMSELSTLEKTFEWLKRHEPALHDYLVQKDFPILDFKYLRKYSRASSLCISEKRYALTGDACFFVDPVYSGGLDVISFCNTAITQAIAAESRNNGDFEICVSFINKITQEMNDIWLVVLDNMYEQKDNWYYIFMKYMADAALYFGALAPFGMNEGFKHLDKADEIWDIMMEVFAIYKDTVRIINQNEYTRYEIPRFLELSHSLFGTVNTSVRVEKNNYEQLTDLLKDNLAVLKKVHEYISEDKNLAEIYWISPERLKSFDNSWRYGRFFDKN